MADTPMVSFAPTEELDLIRSTARQFIAERFDSAKVREVMMSQDGHDPVVWKEMAELGWTGLCIAEEHGGAGFGTVEMGVLLEEMGRVVVPGPFFASAVFATSLVQEVADPKQQSELLPPLATGEKIATVAIFEEPRGWSPEAPATTASRENGGWTISGTKRAVLAGDIADLILVTATTGEGVGVFAVTSGAEGLTVEPEPAFDPTRRQATVSFDEVSVDDGALLGDGNALERLTRSLNLTRVALASEQVGGAQKCMDMSVEYAKTRYQFGRPIGSYQSIKHRCANMLMKVEHARSTAYYAARVTDDAEELSVAAPLAASVASETYVWVAGETIQVHGGIGFTWEHDAHIYLKRAKSSSLLFGSPRYQRDLLGRAIGI